MYSLHKVQHDKSSIQGDVAKAYRYPITFSRRLSAMKYARMVPSSEDHPSLPHFIDLENFCSSLENAEIVWGKNDPILGKQLIRAKQTMKRARVTEVEAGHFLQEEAFKEIAAAIVRLHELNVAQLHPNELDQ